MTYICKCCSGTKFRYLFPGKDRLHGLPGEFKVEECTHCDIIAIHPQLSSEEIEKYYPQDYVSFPPAIEDERSWFKRIDREIGVEKRCKAVIKQSGRTSGKILDIGCATGVFLNSMQKHGWECYGVEPSDFASDYAINRLGLNIFHGYLTDGIFEENFFDVITLWDVIEHLSEPVETLQIISKILKPGGLLVVTTPNANSWERKIFGEYWAGWDVPRHYHIFTPNTLQSLLSPMGFRAFKIKSFTGMQGSLVISLRFLLGESRLPFWIKQFLISFSQTLISRFLLYPYFFIANRFNCSTSMTIFFKKDCSSP